MRERRREEMLDLNNADGKTQPATGFYILPYYHIQASAIGIFIKIVSDSTSSTSQHFIVLYDVHTS